MPFMSLTLLIGHQVGDQHHILTNMAVMLVADLGNM